MLIADRDYVIFQSSVIWHIQLWLVCPPSELTLLSSGMSPIFFWYEYSHSKLTLPTIMVYLFPAIMLNLSSSYFLKCNYYRQHVVGACFSKSIWITSTFELEY